MLIVDDKRSIFLAEGRGDQIAKAVIAALLTNVGA